MAVADFNVGRDVKVVLLLGALGRITFAHVTGFESKQVVDKVRVKPLNTPRISRDLPGGWDGSFTIDRANSTADDLASTLEAAFWNGVRLPSGTLYEYISETDGSTSTYQYDGVTVNLSNAGTKQAEQVIKQTVEFSAGRRRRI